jgi:putative endonuclease
MSRSTTAWCVYILSNNAHTLYVGSTNDLLRRLIEHKTKVHGGAFTARYTFDRCVYFEFAATETEARELEKRIKGWTRARKVALIQQSNPNWIDLTPRAVDLLALK